QMQQAVALDPTYAPAYAALGAVQFIGGGRDAARQSFEKAVQLDPRSVDARLALANYDWAVGDGASAERELKAARAVDATTALAHRALALYYLSDRRPAEAEPHFKALAAISPEGQLALADYYMGLGRYDQAINLLRPFATAPSSRSATARQARMRMAAIEHARGNHADAMAIVAGLVREKPKDPDAHVLAARLLLAEGGDLNVAGQHTRDAVAADPSSTAAHYTTGLVLLARQDYKGAEAAFQETLKLNPRPGARSVRARARSRPGLRGCARGRRQRRCRGARRAERARACRALAGRASAGCDCAASRGAPRCPPEEAGRGGAPSADDHRAAAVASRCVRDARRDL